NAFPSRCRTGTPAPTSSTNCLPKVTGDPEAKRKSQARASYCTTRSSSPPPMPSRSSASSKNTAQARFAPIPTVGGKSSRTPRLLRRTLTAPRNRSGYGRYAAPPDSSRSVACSASPPSPPKGLGRVGVPVWPDLVTALNARAREGRRERGVRRGWFGRLPNPTCCPSCYPEPVSNADPLGREPAGGLLLQRLL